jgi:addiction module HigA family antidote
MAKALALEEMRRVLPDNTAGLSSFDGNGGMHADRHIDRAQKRLCLLADHSNQLQMSNTMRMHNPPHPGEILSQLWLEPLGLSLSSVSEDMKVPLRKMFEILNGRAAIDLEIAMRLEIAFGKSAVSWLAHQATFDLWQTECLKDLPPD